MKLYRLQQRPCGKLAAPFLALGFLLLTSTVGAQTNMQYVKQPSVPKDEKGKIGSPYEQKKQDSRQPGQNWQKTSARSTKRNQSLVNNPLGKKHAKKEQRQTQPQSVKHRFLKNQREQTQGIKQSAPAKRKPTNTPMVKFTPQQQEMLTILERGRKRLEKRRKTPSKLQQATKTDMDLTVKALVKGDTNNAVVHWRAVVNTMTTSKRSLSAPLVEDMNGLVHEILRETYLQTNADLVAYADKVRQYEKQKEEIRSYLNKLRKSTQEPKSGTPVSKTSTLKRPDGTTLVVASKISLENEIDKWEQELASIGDDAQLANLDLQNMLQKQQQTIQIMSNISKTLYDTAMSIIRNMR